MGDSIQVRPIIGAPGYFVTSDGRVISRVRKTPRELRARPDDDGYLTVQIVIDGRIKPRRIHRLVAAAFLPPRPSPAHEIRHLDGTRINCCDTNLAWGTRSQNGVDRVRHRNAPNEKLKLSTPDVIAIRRRADAGERYTAIAADFPVGAWQVSVIARRLQWKHVPEKRGGAG